MKIETFFTLVLIGVIILGFLFFIGIANDKTCQNKYGDNWHLISKGQFFCENNKGDLKNY